jgi:hypothetical protein
MLQRPSGEVTARELVPVAVLVAVTVAAGTPAPCSLVTRPESADVVTPCARARPAFANASSNAHSSSAAVCVTRFIEIPLEM